MVFLLWGGTFRREQGAGRMGGVAMGELAVVADVEATSTVYGSAAGPDKRCCSACATFVLAVERGAFPGELVRFLRQLGVDPTKASEVWGAPESQFLGVWWPFVGNPTTASTAVHQLPGGITVRVTDNFPRPAWDPGGELRAVELLWNSPLVAKLAGDARRRGQR